MSDHEDTHTKALGVIDQDLVERDDIHHEVWWVMGNSPSPYRVQVAFDPDGGVDFITCTCPHGLRKGGGDAQCYHARAVLIKLGVVLR